MIQRRRASGRLERIAAFFRPRRAEPAAERAAILMQRERYASARGLIAAFYAMLLFLAAAEIFSWPGYLEVTTLTPRWAVAWLRFIDLRAGIGTILALHVAAGLLGILASGQRWARVLVAVAWLEFLSFKFSFGAINHGDHLGVLLAFVLIFLPDGWNSFPTASRRVRVATLLTFSGCQALILLTYSMAGLWKVGGVIEQLLRGETSYLSPQGFAQQIADKLLADQSTSLLGPWLIDHYWLGWPLILVALYLEFSALWVVFRPSLHQAWGVGLLSFHLATHLTLGVGFPQNVLWLALFLVFSPLRPAERSWRGAWRDLPGLGGWIERAFG